MSGTCPSCGHDLCRCQGPAVSTPETDVTAQVRFQNPDDEALPLTRCVCGAVFAAWDGPVLSIYPDIADPLSCCGRRLYFKQTIHVIEVKP